MGFIETSRIEDLQEHVEPFRSAAAAFEIESRLNDITNEAALRGRAVPTTNDRYQMTAAYLKLTRNQLLAVEGIYESVTADDDKDTKGPNFSYKALGSAMINAYNGVRSGLQAADIIWGEKGFQPNQEWLKHLREAVDLNFWLPQGHISGRYVKGAATGVDTAATHVNHDIATLFESSLLSNMYRFKIGDGIKPLSIVIESQRKLIDRTGLRSNQPHDVLATTFKGSQLALMVLNQIALWTTYPQLFDASLTPAEPLDDTGRSKKEFSPQKLGIQVAQTRTSAGAPSKQDDAPIAPSAKNRRAFTPETVNRQSKPKTNSTEPTRNLQARGFDPAVAQRPVTPEIQSEKRPAERPFVPTVTTYSRLDNTGNQARTPNPVDSVDPITPKTANPTADQRPFDPAVVVKADTSADNPITRNVHSHNKPFEPTVTQRPVTPEAQQANQPTDRPFDPTAVSRTTSHPPRIDTVIDVRAIEPDSLNTEDDK